MYPQYEFFVFVEIIIAGRISIILKERIKKGSILLLQFQTSVGFKLKAYNYNGLKELLSGYVRDPNLSKRRIYSDKDDR